MQDFDYHTKKENFHHEFHKCLIIYVRLQFWNAQNI